MEALGDRVKTIASNHMKEIWKPIPGYEALYEVSNTGHIRTPGRRVFISGRKREFWKTYPARTLKACVRKWQPRGSTVVPAGLCVHLCRDGVRKMWHVHQLVLLAFVGPRPAGLETRHLDGNAWNNQLSNLCYGTVKENKADMEKHGRSQRGERQWMAKLTAKDVRRIRALVAAGQMLKQVARMYGISGVHVGRIVQRRVWTHVQ